MLHRVYKLLWKLTQLGSVGIQTVSGPLGSPPGCSVGVSGNDTFGSEVRLFHSPREAAVEAEDRWSLPRG